jgi:hypothetical protein
MRLVEADEALLEAWTLDEHCDAWPCPYEIERYEQLLPTLIESGHAETSEVGDPPIRVWAFTDAAEDRWHHLQSGQS